MQINRVFKGHMLICLLLLTGCVHQNEKEKTENEPHKFNGSKFSVHVRTTEPQTPEEEKQGFKLPPGFEIELYAEEPNIGKPMNIAFDAKGRLWVTQSFEYPFPATPGEGKDRITILEDKNHDGKADSFIHFNDTLNIPIGILPVNDGAIAYSIPNVYKFTDTDGDGKADHQQKLFGPFEHKDTHGMVNNLTRGYDGWVHADHGFSNVSTIAGTDGDSIHMTSGNTFRFRTDGSHVEQTTFGRVNPFGLVYDELGYLYSTDCHSSPIYQLIQGADYPHFGKKEEGIGFAPDMRPHGEEATALAGNVYYSATQFPEAYQKNIFIGDVITCRIYRYSFEFKGSTPVATKEPDFLMSEDPWFRPVDMKLGPDGALYVADFYNRIIGHYEVPLDHPGRDRVRGRIWRITYKGKDHEAENKQKRDWTTASPDELISALDDDNLVVRMMAADQLVDRIGQSAVLPVSDILNDKNASARQYAHALWVLHRLHALSEDMIKQAAIHPDSLVRIHTMRILREREDPEHQHYFLASNALDDPNPHVQRAAVEAVAKYPGMESLEAMLAHKAKIPEYDSHDLYTTRLWLRNLMREESLMQQVVARKWNDQDATALADVVIGVNNTDAGIFLYDYIQSHTVPEALLANMVQHVARFIPQAQLDKAVNLARQKSVDGINAEFLMFSAVRQGMAQRGAKANHQMTQWGTQLAQNILNQYYPDNAEDVVQDSTQAPEDIAAQQKLAVEIAGDYKLVSLEPKVKACFQQKKTKPEVKVSSARALLQIAPARNAKLIDDMLQIDTLTLDFKKQMVGLLGEFPGPATRKVLASVKNIPPGLQTDIVMALAGSPQGRNIIFEKVRSGEVFPRILVEPKVEERILLNISDAQLEEFGSLTSSLASINEEKEKLIRERLAQFAASDSLISTGHTLFMQNCSPCHRIGNEGGMIGPQLTGIGNWGAKALAEKILDPNRNISEAFKNYTIEMKDGKVINGLYRRDEGEVIVFANISGDEFSVPKDMIASQQASKYTLMPDNFGNKLSQEDFNALLSYLLNQQ